MAKLITVCMLGDDTPLVASDAWTLLNDPKFIKRADLLVPFDDPRVLGFAKGKILRLIVEPETFYSELSSYLDPAL